MKQWAVTIGICAALAGCRSDGNAGAPPAAPGVPSRQAPSQAPAARQPSTRPAAAEPVLATLGDLEIRRDAVVEPLINDHGLDYLLQIATLELTRTAAESSGIYITDQDVQDEMDHTLARMFPDASPEDHARLLEQLLEQQSLSHQQFEMVMRTNAHLRKIVEPVVEEKITEEALQEAFGALYGETIRVRHIQLANMQEVADAQRRLAQGQPFEQVARDLSRNANSGPRGGELTPFSRQMQGLPELFKEAAFALDLGEVSDAVQSEGAYHLIRLEERIPPKAVDFEDHRDAVREKLHESMMTQGTKQLRNQLAQEVMQRIDIQHPALDDQFQTRIRAGQTEAAEREEILRDLERQRERSQIEPTPTTAPAAPPATAPASDAPAANAATTQPTPIEANK